MSALLHSLFTIETVEIDRIMKYKMLYRQITGEELGNHNIINHITWTYVDHTQLVVLSNNHNDLKNYMQELHILLIHVYSHNSLSINADKTKFMNFEKSSDDAAPNLIIIDDKGNMIPKKKMIKILGYKVNKDDNLEDHMASLMTKIKLSHNEI